MSNITVEEAKRILKLAIIQKNEIKMEELVVDLKINNNQIELLYSEEITNNKPEYILEFNYEDLNYKLKCKINNKSSIQIIEVISNEFNKNRLINTEDYGILTLNEDKSINVNINNISQNSIFFKILKKDEDAMFNNLDKNLKLTIKYKEKEIEFDVNPKIESVSKTEDTIIYSEIKIKKQEDKKLFNEYIKEKSENQNKKEKSKLINNLIKEMY